MASLIVIAFVMGVAGVLIGAFVSVTIAIHLGRRVRSLIWRMPAQPARRGRPLVDSSRRG
jgi:hypothetical protein